MAAGGVLFGRIVRKFKAWFCFISHRCNFFDIVLFFSRVFKVKPTTQEVNSVSKVTKCAEEAHVH